MALFNPQSKQEFQLYILVLSAIPVCLHLYTNGFGSYGIFRDELYYLACADHLDWGYVDQPPFSIWILALVKGILGKSLFAIRLLPAILSGASVYLYGKLTYLAGGKRLSILLVSLGMTVSGIQLGFGTFYSMNAIDLVLWPFALLLLIRLIENPKPSTWLELGIILGLVCLNKVGGLILCLGIFVTILIYLRKELKTIWPYSTAVIALLLFSPYVWWNLTHDMAHLEFIRNASAYKYNSLNALSFWTGQILINNPFTLPIWISALFFAFNRPHNRAYLPLLVTFCMVALVFTLNGTSKPEYLAAIFPVLLIGGARQIEIWSGQKKWVPYPFVASLCLGIVIIPLALPILPVEAYLNYQNAIGIRSGNSEGKKESELPQFYADMHGWESKAEAISKVFQTLSAEERAKTCFYGQNYGQAGAVEYYQDKYPLPKSIGSHNNYWIWGPQDCSGEIIIEIDDEIGSRTDLFESVEDHGTITCDYCMPYENNLRIIVSRNLHSSIDSAWSKLKHYN